MTHTILVQQNQQAVIIEHDDGRVEVTAFVENIPSVAYDTTTFAEAERWAKAVIGYTG